MVNYLVFLIFSTGLYVALGTLLVRHFWWTRFAPSVHLATFFFLIAVGYILYMPISWLGPEDETAARLTLESSLVFMVFPWFILVVFFEGVARKSVTPISMIHLGVTAFLLGYSTTPRWHIVYLTEGWTGWTQPFNLDFAILFFIQLMFALVVAVTRLVQFHQRVWKKRNAKVQEPSPLWSILSISALVAGVLACFFIMIANIQFWDFLFLNLGFAVMGVVYLAHPEAFFLFQAEIRTVIFFNADSGLPYLIVGADKVDVELASVGLHSSTMLQQHIAQSERLPSMLIFGDRAYHLAYRKVGDDLVAVALISDLPVQALNLPLKHVLSLFVQIYAEEIHNKIINSAKFYPVVSHIQKVFNFTSIDVNSSCGNPP